MSQLADITYIVQNHTDSNEAAGALLWDILNALGWDIEGVCNAEDAAVYLQMER